jgi:hypothetical protein
MVARRISCQHFHFLGGGLHRRQQQSSAESQPELLTSRVLLRSLIAIPGHAGGCPQKQLAVTCRMATRSRICEARRALRTDELQHGAQAMKNCNLARFACGVNKFFVGAAEIFDFAILEIPDARGNFV